MFSSIDSNFRWNGNTSIKIFVFFGNFIFDRKESFFLPNTNFYTETYLGWIPGLKIGITFLCQRFFHFKKTESDSVNQADSGDIKILVQFPGNPILKFLLNFLYYVGGTHMRGCFKLKITQWLYLITLVILTRKIKGNYLISPSPTQF